MVCITAASNVVATMPNLKEIINVAHEKGAKVLVDASQIIAHKKMDVSDLDVDFLVFFRT